MAVDPAEVRVALRSRLGRGRAAHCERVAAAAAALASHHGLDARAAELAGLLHDWYRECGAEEIVAVARACGVVAADAPEGGIVPDVLHGPVAARLLPARWPDLPPAVLAAIDRHTTGDPEMTEFDCLVYVADLIEPGHRYRGVEALRSLAQEDLWASTLAAMDAAIVRLVQLGRRIDPRTVAARNTLLARKPPLVRRPEAGG